MAQGPAARVEFHTGVPDVVEFGYRLLRKALRQQARLLCTAPTEVLEQLDRALWTWEERDFVPHVRVPGAAAAVAARTPLWLASDALEAGRDRILVNLGAPLRMAEIAVARFPRVIEVVSAHEEPAEAGRQRWRECIAAGLEIKHYPSPSAAT